MQLLKYPFTLPELPYPRDALAPYISATTLDIHHGRHHKTYVDNLNNFIKGHCLENSTLDEIILQTHQNVDDIAIFNNAAQVWNHTFYWHSMTKNGGLPGPELAKKIDEDFGSYEKFKEEFTKAALSQFGSGWAWLVYDHKTKSLKITKTGNADLPMTKDQKAILTVDVWEHAYYIDYQNKRADYLKNFCDNLINWDFAKQNFLAV